MSVAKKQSDKYRKMQLKNQFLHSRDINQASASTACSNCEHICQYRNYTKVNKF